MNYKLSIAFLLMCMMINNAYGQIKKGDKMVGATVANIFLNSGSGDQTVTSIGSLNYKTTEWGVNIHPSMGWFINDKTAIGANIVLNPNSYKISYETNGSTFQKDEVSRFNMGLGVFARNYFSNSSDWLPFGQIGISGGMNTSETEGFFYGGSGPTVYKETYTGKSSGGGFFNGSLSIGLTRLVNDHAGLDIFAGYNFTSSNNTFKTVRLRDDNNNGQVDTRSENNTETKVTTHGFVVGVGFQVFLRGKKK